MNKGKIEQAWNGELYVTHTYINEHLVKMTSQMPIHPFFKNYQFTIDQEINFEYALECEKHYPIACHCQRVILYALPIIKKQKPLSLIDKLKSKWQNIKRFT